MIGRMKNGASPREDDPSPAPDSLNRFDHFVGIQPDDRPPLKPFDVARVVDDLPDDMVWWRDVDSSHAKPSVSCATRKAMARRASAASAGRSRGTSWIAPSMSNFLLGVVVLPDVPPIGACNTRRVTSPSWAPRSSARLTSPSDR
jgi:hypothetical protein